MPCNGIWPDSNRNKEERGGSLGHPISFLRLGQVGDEATSSGASEAGCEVPACRRRHARHAGTKQSVVTDGDAVECVGDDVIEIACRQGVQRRVQVTDALLAERVSFLIHQGD